MNHPEMPPILPQDGEGDPKRRGRWETLPASCAGAATHVALLHTNKIFMYGGSSLDEEAFADPPPAELLDLATGEIRQISMRGVEADIWCGGHTFLANGRLLFVGGTGYYPKGINPFFGGHKQAYLFDPVSESWERLPDMASARWYPTLLRLGDNRVLTIGGTRDAFPELWQRELEFYIPEEGWQSLPEKRLFPLYPRLHLLPDGNVFYSGIFNTHYTIPWAFPSMLWEHATGVWREVGGPHHSKKREEGISLLLALRPPDYRAEVLVAGGGNHNRIRMLLELLEGLGAAHWISTWRSNRALVSVERIDLADPEAQWVDDSRMNYPRLHGVGVLLPDGNVAVVGGMARHAPHGQKTATLESQSETAVLPAELYDSATRTWRVMAAQRRPRVYHSTALLLPDGRVISMGGNPYARIVERSIEIFSPPYLFKGNRPVIVRAPEQIACGETFEVQVDKARDIAQVVLMRPEVLTHVTNTDQRLLELEFRAVGEDRLEVSGPPSHNHMPQGYVMLFALNQDGVPAEAPFIRLI